MDINELDIIKVDNSINIEQWNDKLLKLCKNMNVVLDFRLPLDKGYIRFESDSFDIQFENRNEYIKLVMFWNHDNEQNKLEYAQGFAKAVSFRYYPNTKEIHNIVYPNRYIDKLKDMFKDGKMIQRMVDKFHALMNYAVYGEQIVEKKSKTNNSTSKQIEYRTNNSNRIHTLVRKTYVFNDMSSDNQQEVNNNIEESVKRSYTKITSEWTVKGHYRRYKNGKVIWVNSYKKGTGNNKTSKVYKA